MATVTASVNHKLSHLLPTGMPIGVILGPLVGLLIWWLPLELQPSIHKALAIIGFMVVYWIAEPIDPGMTAIIGCFLFWASETVPSTTAFSGFTSITPWYVFGSMLMGHAASRTGLAKRIGALVIHRVGTSYIWLLLGLIILVCGLNFFIPSPVAQITTLAPIVIGIAAALGFGAHSNGAKGLFIALTYTASLFNKMFLNGNVSIMARGIIEEQTGVQVLWSQWFIAFLPLIILTVIVSWLTIRWLYPAESLPLPTAQSSQSPLQDLGPWSQDEQKTLLWLLLAIILWATDFLHHTNPAVIGLGIALFLVLPKAGVLDMKAVKSLNFLLIAFVGGALSMGRVLTETGALDVLTGSLEQWLMPWLSHAMHASMTLYWGGFLYHFLVGSEYTMLSTLLPILLKVADVQGYNLAALGLMWTFAGTGKLFMYQSSALILGYSYGMFTVKDLLKVGAVLTVVEGLLIMVLVPVYWPLVGLAWTTAPSKQQAVAVYTETSSGETSVDHVLEASQAPGHVPLRASAPSISQPRVDRGEESVAALAPRQQVSATAAAAALPSVGPDPEAEVWGSVRGSTALQDFTAFLTAYPASRFAVAARLRLRQLLRQYQTGIPPITPGELSRPLALGTWKQAQHPAAERAAGGTSRGRSSGGAESGATAAAGTGPGTPRIYIHIRREENRGPARSLAQKLHAQGFLVPDIELLAHLGPRVSQLRCFHKAAKPEAQAIVDFLTALGLEVTLRHMAGYETSRVMRPQHYELWFAPGEPRERR